MAGKRRAEEARRGTKADPARAAGAVQAAPGGAPAGADGAAAVPSWYAEPLDEGALPAREVTTRRVFLTVEVLLCLVPVMALASISAEAGGLTTEGMQELFATDPLYAVDLLVGCVQVLAAWLLRLVWRRYLEGDVGYVAGNLVAVVCAQIVLQSVVGIVGSALLLWRTWRRTSGGLAAWARGRGVGGVLLDLSGSLVLLCLAALCLFASARLA